MTKTEILIKEVPDSENAKTTLLGRHPPSVPCDHRGRSMLCHKCLTFSLVTASL